MKNNLPKVSVIIPCYNHVEYLEQSIKSVLNQTYSNIELIVIDDGSTDGSVKALKALAENYGFTLIIQQNIGLSNTLNKAIKKFSSGEFIAVLASDDYYHVNKIEKQVLEIANNKNSEFCYTKSVEFESQTGEEIRVFPSKKFTGSVLKKIFLRQPYAAGSILFSKSLYNRVGGFDERLKYEDWDFSIRCAALTEFCVVDEVLFYYRSHSLNLTKTMNRKSIFEQKLKTLNKNSNLVSGWIFTNSIFVHFFYDYFLYKTKFNKLKRFFH